MKVQFMFLIVATFCVYTALVSSSGAVILTPGDLVVADQNGSALGSVYKVDPTTGAPTVVSSGGYLDNPIRLEIDWTGNIFVLDQPYSSNSAELIKINPANGTQQLISSGNLMTSPQGLCMHDAGDFFVADSALSGTGGILKIDPITGVQTVLASGGYFHGVAGVAMGKSGYLYANTANASGPGLAVVKIDPYTGAQTLVSSDTFNVWISDVTVADTGNIYAGEIYWNEGVIKVNPATGNQSFLAQGFPFEDPTGLDTDLMGNIIVADTNWDWVGKLIRINASTGVATVIASGGLLVDPYDVAVYEAPEPSTVVLLVMGVVGLAFHRWRRR